MPTKSAVLALEDGSIFRGLAFGADATTALLRVDSNGMVSTSTGGVRVLFDGVPAPMVYALSGQCSAVVPYFGATKATTHVQVEYQGVRSDPLEVAVGATAWLFVSPVASKT